ncbi:MAG TPA: RDD family protein [Bacilli bacterium]|nr:RDD family protein [Bacilli bacterium]
MLNEGKRAAIKATAKVAGGSLWKRLVAAIIDFIIAFFIGLLLYQVAVHPLWFDYLGGYQDNMVLNEIKIDSGLYAGYAEDPLQYVDNDDIDQAMRSFYLDWDGFDFTESSFYEDHPAGFEYNRDVLQMDSENAIILDYTVEDGHYTYIYRTDLEEGAIDSFWSASYAEAINNLEDMPSYFTAQKPIRNFVFIGGAISYFLSGFIFHLCIPLFIDDGRTIGKMAMGLAVTDITGYRLSHKQMVIRYLVTDIFETIGSILYLLPLFISVAVMTLSKRQRPIHDWVASTMVVDWNTSQIFASQEEETKYDLACQMHEPIDIYPSGGRSEADNRRKKEASIRNE